MTVTNHTALYRFTFPSDLAAIREQTPLPNSPLILVQLTDLPESMRAGKIEANNSTGRLTGNGTFSPSFGTGSYKLHFCVDFSGASVRNGGIFRDDGTASDLQDPKKALDGAAGAWTQFEAPPNNQILARVGVSFISVDQACQNAETEIPDYNFDKVQAEAEKAWREKFTVVQVDATGVSDEFQTIFWSGIYRTMISPQDYTGENPLWNSTEPYYDSFYCIWDSFRSHHPLLTLLDPDIQTRMVRSLIDIYRHTGMYTEDS